MRLRTQLLTRQATSVLAEINSPVMAVDPRDVVTVLSLIQLAASSRWHTRSLRQLYMLLTTLPRLLISTSGNRHARPRIRWGSGGLQGFKLSREGRSRGYWRGGPLNVEGRGANIFGGNS